MIRPTSTRNIAPINALVGDAALVIDALIKELSYRKSGSGDNALAALKADIAVVQYHRSKKYKALNLRPFGLSGVESICQIKTDTLASHMAGAEDFTKRFVVLKSKYESASKCAINVKQAFRDVVLSDMTQPPEILKSMTESIEGDVTRVSDAENQTVDLAAKVEASKKAMKTIEKIYRAMCVKDKTAVIGRTSNADPAGH